MNGHTNGHAATNGHANGVNGKLNGNGITAPRVEIDEEIASLKMNGHAKEQKVVA